MFLKSNMWRTIEDGHCMTHRAPSVWFRSVGITGSREFRSEEGKADTHRGEGCLRGQKHPVAGAVQDGSGTLLAGDVGRKCSTRRDLSKVVGL